jgi:ubiquinone/menaquinone biosynthesis C-methylase UbiE
MKRASMAVLAVLALPALLMPALAPAQAPSGAATAPGYVEGRASPDGIGRVYMGREIARVMSFHGAAWLERQERLREERPDLLLPELALKPGMTVADIGAGTGFHSRRMAQAVGPDGIVYAVDIQPEMLAALGKLAAERGIANIRPVLGTAVDPKLPAGGIDLALMVDVYHELESPYEMLGAIVRALKPGGRLVFVEYKAEDEAVPIRRLHKMTEAQVRKEALAHALEWERTVATLPWQHVVVFRRK